jgi:hypothetical protein
VNWQARIRQLLLAGGSISFVGSLGCQQGPPCGNANSDPCICGRPQTLCDEKKSCEGSGGTWIDDEQHCLMTDAGVPDAPPRDAGVDAAIDAAVVDASAI